MGENFKSVKKTVCQNTVATATSNLMNKDMSNKLLPDFGESLRARWFLLANYKRSKRSKSAQGTSTPPPPARLNRGGS